MYIKAYKLDNYYNIYLFTVLGCYAIIYVVTEVMMSDIVKFNSIYCV